MQTMVLGMVDGGGCAAIRDTFGPVYTRVTDMISHSRQFESSLHKSLVDRTDTVAQTGLPTAGPREMYTIMPPHTSGFRCTQ